MKAMTGLRGTAMAAVLFGMALGTLARVTQAVEKNQETLATSPLKTVLIDTKAMTETSAPAPGVPANGTSSAPYYSGVVWNCTQKTVSYQISLDGVRWTNQSLAPNKAMAYYYERSYRGQMTPVKVRYDYIWGDGKTTYMKSAVLMKWCNRPIDGLLYKFLLFNNRDLTLRVVN